MKTIVELGSVVTLGLTFGTASCAPHEGLLPPAPTLTAQELAEQAGHDNLVAYLKKVSEAGPNFVRSPAQRIGVPIFVLDEEGRKAYSAPFLSNTTLLAENRWIPDIGLIFRQQAGGSYVVDTEQALPDGNKIYVRWLSQVTSADDATFHIMGIAYQDRTEEHIGLLNTSSRIQVQTR